MNRPFQFAIPRGMSRRHFVQHLAGASALTLPALSLTHTLQANATTLQRERRAAILLWMGGGPSTIDLWDQKAGNGPFQSISTRGDVQICEHLPRLAQQMHHLSIVRSMSTQEADHGRGRYYMHTGYVPNPDVDHPSYGAVIAHELAETRATLEIPPFVSVGGSSLGPGFLGMAWAPFVVNSNGTIRNLGDDADRQRMAKRLEALQLIETGFIRQSRGTAAADHAKVLQKTWDLMTSQQMDAFQVRREPAAVQDRYGRTGFGRGCLMARRLVEQGVPFVEVDLGGWDNHSNIFPTLQDNRLPVMDQAMSALVEDLDQRGLLDTTAILWMGEFGRTPNVNANRGRDHFARAWSVVLGGAGMKGGVAVGATSADGSEVVSQPYTSQDIMATICQAMGISLETTFKSRSGRPMKIANAGRVIDELFS